MDFESFLKWSLPELGLRWEGFVDVYGQVAKRLRDRMTELELGSLEAYRRYIDEHPEEWREVDACCRVTISRFYRDAEVFDAVREEILPKLTDRATDADRGELRLWSAGAASGEEPYTLSMCAAFTDELERSESELAIVASEVYRHMLDRAERAVYPASSLEELPEGWIDRCFEEVRGGHRLCEDYREPVRFVRHDVREALPSHVEPSFDLVAARYLPFTYFAETHQVEFLDRCAEWLDPAGFLVIGADESLPGAADGWEGAGSTGAVFQPASA
ncbi:MAG: protein-glutamate O-methyltransferase CheR [Bradymonadaceae bacterium]